MRTIVAYKRYFLDFYEAQNEKVQSKIEWTLGLIRDLDQIPKKYFKQVSDYKGLFEIRVEYEGNIYRIFSFFEAGDLIILGNAFQKKSQKTPKNEITRALRIKKEYFDETSLSK